MSLIAVYREPFSVYPVVQRLPEGKTLSELASRMSSLPDDFEGHGTICLNGQPVPRGLWPMVKPKPLCRGVPTEITFHAPPRGGGDSEGKNPLALIASIAITVATGFIAGGGLFAKGILGPAFAKGTFGALALSAGVSLAGSLLLGALAPPPSVPDGSKLDRQQQGAASANGNILEPNGPVPRVVGTRKIFPPLASEPLTYFEGQDEVVEAGYVLAGPHELTDLRISGAPIDSTTGVDFETREGWPGDDRATLLSRQGRTEVVQSELRGHTVSDVDGRTLESATGAQNDALPQPLVVVTRDAPDEHQLQIAFPGGLHRTKTDTDQVRVPLRLRMREIGETDWINLPELHFQGENLNQLRATIRLVWTDDATTTPGAAQSEGWVEVRKLSPGQAVAPVQSDWEADSYFDAGSGDDYLTINNIGTTGVDHVIMNRFEASIFLDTAIFAPGRYEIEIKRGAPIWGSVYSSSAYTVSSVVWDLFGYQGSPGVIPQSRDNVADGLYVLRSVSIWNEHPIPTDDFALIAVRARNRAVEELSVVASGYVLDHDGSDWNDWVTTSNPAPHVRDIYTGLQNADPVPLDIVDDAGLLDWRAACIASGYECNAIIEGQSVAEAVRIVAACGYARPYMSDIWGVVRDYDRSAESPVQIFNPRNSGGFKWTKAFANVPDGFLITFNDKTRDYDRHQITHPPEAAGGKLEQVTFEGLVTEAEVRARADFDLKQAQLRATFYSLDAGAESIVCRRGSLVGVQHDMLREHAGSARIVDLEFDASGDVTAVALDSDVPIINEPDMHAVTDMHAVLDMHMVGRSTGAVLRRSDGSATVHEATGSGDSNVITFASPVSPTALREDLLVTVGPLGQEQERLIVFGIEPREDLTAALTFVDEAPEIWA